MEQEKKANILKITKQLEQVGKDSFKELEDQGNYLKKTKQNVKEIKRHVTKIDENLDEIKRNRNKNLIKNCFRMICCTYCLNGRSKVKSEQFERSIKEINENMKNPVDEPNLTPERIEKEWCMRYDPENKWIKQVELGLDYLLELAEQMKQSFDEQNELAEQIYLDVRSNQNRIKNSRQKMQAIQENA